MKMSSAPDDQWPAEGLEAVDQCPICASPQRAPEISGLADRTFGVAPGAWNLVRCLQCRSVYLNPRPTQDTIGLAYRRYFTHAAPQEDEGGQWSRLKRALTNAYRNREFGTHLRPALKLGAYIVPLFPERANFILREARGLQQVKTAGAVLDVGCGNGEFLRLARAMGWDCYGIELDPSAAEIARSCGAQIIASRLSDVAAEYDSFFHALTMSHVIEHLPNPIDALRRCHALMKPGAPIWIETPNIDGVGYARFGRNWRGLETPRHLVILNRSSLGAALERAGFVDVRFLPPQNRALWYTYTCSVAMAAGRIAEADHQSPEELNLHRVAEMVRADSAATHRNPATSEFINIVARRPNAAGDGDQASFLLRRR